MRYTPEIIDKLWKDEVFVFGSNESGFHGAGAARVAADKFGAKMGQGFGMAGHTFAIPTKDWDIQSLPLDVIGMYITRFIAYAKLKRKKTFLVTKIGCGLAGFSVEDIAQFFRETRGPRGVGNIILPKEFVDSINEWQRRSQLP